MIITVNFIEQHAQMEFIFHLYIQGSASKFIFHLCIQNSASKFIFHLCIQDSASKFIFHLYIQGSASKFIFHLYIQNSASQFIFQLYIQNSASQFIFQLYIQNSASKFIFLLLQPKSEKCFLRNGVFARNSDFLIPIFLQTSRPWIFKTMNSVISKNINGLHHQVAKIQGLEYLKSVINSIDVSVFTIHILFIFHVSRRPLEVKIFYDVQKHVK